MQKKRFFVYELSDSIFGDSLAKAFGYWYNEALTCALHPEAPGRRHNLGNQL